MFSLVTRGKTKDLSKLVDSFLDDRWFDTHQKGVDFPKVDILDLGDKVVVQAEIPGVDKEEIEIFVEEGRLFVTGEKKRESQEKEGRYHRVERTYGKFTRSFLLGETLDSESIQASHENGVLNITIPKMEPVEPERKKIEIKG